MRIDGQWLWRDDGIMRPVMSGEILAGNGSWEKSEFLVDISADRTVLSAATLAKQRGMTVSDTVLYDKDGHVVTITYHRPERMNAINGQMRDELNAAWLRFRDDTDAWVAILTGAGRAFCAGADIREGGAAGIFAGTFWEKPTINSFESGLELFKPTIAAINGPCLGYGVTAIAFCDFVIASQRATFGFPEVRLGVPTIVGAI